MKMINNLRNGIYRNKTDKLVYFEKVFKLLNDCNDLNIGDEFLSLLDVGHHKFLRSIIGDGKGEVCLLSDEELE